MPIDYGTNEIIASGNINLGNIQISNNTIAATNTNGNIIVQSNGTGALQRDSGGNTRGQYSVDLQNVRSATQPFIFCIGKKERSFSIVKTMHFFHTVIKI